MDASSNVQVATPTSGIKGPGNSSSAFAVTPEESEQSRRESRYHRILSEIESVLQSSSEPSVVKYAKEGGSRSYSSHASEPSATSSVSEKSGEAEPAAAIDVNAPSESEVDDRDAPDLSIVVPDQSESTATNAEESESSLSSNSTSLDSSIASILAKDPVDVLTDSSDAAYGAQSVVRASLSVSEGKRRAEPGDPNEIKRGVRRVGDDVVKTFEQKYRAEEQQEFLNRHLGKGITPEVVSVDIKNRQIATKFAHGYENFGDLYAATNKFKSMDPAQKETVYRGLERLYSQMGGEYSDLSTQLRNYGVKFENGEAKFILYEAGKLTSASVKQPDLALVLLADIITNYPALVPPSKQKLWRGRF